MDYQNCAGRQRGRATNLQNLVNQFESDTALQININTYMIKISILNQSTVLSDTQVQSYVPRQQMQVSRDFYPAWGIYAKLVWVPKGVTPDPNSWQLVFLDNSDQAGALGYHDLTPNDLPLSKIFAKDDITDGYSWSVTASHECMEMLVDPWINLAAFDNGSRFYAYEVGDPVEADNFGYQIGGLQFSDFVLPSWFEPTTTNGKFSFMNNVHSPFTLAKGGYTSFVDLNQASKGWQQITAATEPKFSPRLNRRRDNLKRKKFLGVF